MDEPLYVAIRDLDTEFMAQRFEVRVGDLLPEGHPIVRRNPTCFAPAPESSPEPT